MPLRNVLVIFIAAVFSLACYNVAAKNRYATLFAEVLEIVNTEALQEVSRDELFSGAIDGMLTKLDDEHSAFVTNANFRELSEDLEQEFGGVGMYVGTDPDTDMMMVLAPIPATPAFNAGIQVGDLIAAIDGQKTQDRPRGEAVESLRGPIGKEVQLEIRRGDLTLHKTLVRGIIPIESAHGDFRAANGQWHFYLKQDPRIGYVRLSQFGEKTDAEMRQALDSLPPQVDSLILDLRANPGGLLEVAVAVCDMFLPSNRPIVKIQGRDEQLIAQYGSSAGMKFPADLPVCILIDRFSASASEIVSGCLQDHGRAVLIGEQSYGKGTVQDLIPIQRNKSMLKLTTASYWRPSNKQIDRNDKQAKETKIWGVQPDPGFEIEMTSEELLENLRYRNQRDVESIAQNTPNAATGTDRPAPENDNGPRPDQSPDGLPPSKHVDRPLDRAIDYLSSLRN